MNGAPPVIDSPAPLPPAFKDRRAGLMLFGIFEILLGAVCFLLIGLMLFGQLMLSRTTGAPLSPGMIAPALAVYLALAVFLIWSGIGSMQCRRWARALSLIFAWGWLLTGLISVPITVVILPRTLAATAPQGAALPPGVMTGIIVVQILFMAVVMVAIPAAFVLFYRSPHVKATCEASDPVSRWTDACPLPLLAVAIVFWLGAVCMLSVAIAQRGVLPFFGMLLEGAPGMVVALGLAALAAWIGRAWYKVRVIGWWVLLVVWPVFSLSSFLTFQRVDIIEMYQKMGYPQAQIEVIRQQGILTSQLMTWSAVLGLVPMLGYLIWVKRFFRPAASE